MKKLAILTVLFVSSMMTAQDMVVVKGNFDFLKGEKEFNVVFNYSNLKVLVENKTETKYVEDFTKELNDKNTGSGDEWKKNWYNAKKGIWNPKFLELINIVCKKEGKEMLFKEDFATAKYTLIVDVVWIFPGWDAFWVKQPAKVSTVLRFVETANNSNVLLEITSDKSPGDQFWNTFSNEKRIGEGFAKTGKSLAKMILKKAFK